MTINCRNYSPNPRDSMQENPYYQESSNDFPKKTIQEKSLAFNAPIDKYCIHLHKKKREIKFSKRAEIAVQRVILSSDELYPSEK
jgi:hypothetical protein